MRLLSGGGIRMTITVKEATDTLLRGETLEWSPHEKLKGGKITLGEGGARRLFAYLLKNPQNLVENADESLFAGLVEAWGKDDDPATRMDATAPQTGHCWLLKEVRTFNFGGLNAFGGDEFNLPVDGASWCLEGQNGSGKTSLASALLWGLTGRRIREYAGIVEDSGRREPVLDANGNSVGNWPPLVAYPKSKDELLNDAEVRVKLTFVNELGEEAFVRRRIVSVGLIGDSVNEVEVDQRLLVAPQLLEAGILMPCRLATLRFGEGSTHLYEAVKMLTGLDQLSAIGDGAANLRHGGRKFIKYSKDKGIDAIAAAFTSSMKIAEEHGKKVGVDVSTLMALDKPNLHTTIQTLVENAKAGAAEQMSTLAVDLGPAIDVKTDTGREEVTKAVFLVKETVDAGFSALAPVKALDVLVKERDEGNLAAIPASLEAIERELQEAIGWHARQQEDAKLRLKALAAPLFEPAEVGPADCPLCAGELLTAAQKALADELTQLKAVGDAAERKLGDACLSFTDRLGKLLPATLRSFRVTLAEMEPKSAVTDAISKGLSDAGSFATVLVGAGKAMAEKAEETASLKEFPATDRVATDEPPEAEMVRKEVSDLRRIIDLAAWWSVNGQAFHDYWDTVVGMPGEDGVVPKDSLSGKIVVLKAAIENAEPFEKLASALESAASKAEEWVRITKEQKVREEVAAALEPLTSLRALVDAETARSISALSGRIGAILDRIHHHERLTYQGTFLKKERTIREVNVHAGFEHAPKMKIDAGLVANKSWLRAILWGFIFALREETVEGLGFNPFPLMLLDDPQTTFDPRNKESWAMELARLTKLDARDPNYVQLLLTTYERHFFDMLRIEQIRAEVGHMLGLVPNGGPVAVENGSEIKRLWADAEASNSDAKAATFVARLRGHCESILKIVLAGHLPPMDSPNLATLRKVMEGLRDSRIMPFTFQPFLDLIKLLDSGEPHIKLLNGLTHDPATTNMATAKRLKDYWDKSLEKTILRALHSYREFRAHRGDPRAYLPSAEIVPLPSAQKEDIRKAILYSTGIATAAATDGRIPFGDGRVVLTEQPGDEIRLGNHDVFRLVAGTMEPVAGIGDFLIVSESAPVSPGNLVVASVGDRLLARRLTVSDSNPDVAVLVAQAIDPYAIAQPVIAPINGFSKRKVVGVLFSGDWNQPQGDGDEVVAVHEPTGYWDLVDKCRLFRVEGRSAEPLALGGQHLIAGGWVTGEAELALLDGRLVIAVDEDGGCYFKRFRVARGDMVVLESQNPNGTCPSELMSLSGESGFPKLTSAFVVQGVLFDLPR